jgi:hypothetical protein
MYSITICSPISSISVAWLLKIKYHITETFCYRQIQFTCFTLHGEVDIMKLTHNFPLNAFIPTKGPVIYFCA